MRNKIFKALAHPLRRDILAALRKSPQLAGDLAGLFDVSWPTVSRHLSVMKDADLVFTERQGNQILYRLNTTVLQDAATLLLGLAGAGANLPLEEELEALESDAENSPETQAVSSGQNEPHKRPQT